MRAFTTLMFTVTMGIMNPMSIRYVRLKRRGADMAKRKSTKIGSIDPNAVKSRDLLHLQEITHGTGCGAHKDKRKRTKHKKREDHDDSDSS